MSRTDYFKVLDLFTRYCELCIDSYEFDKFHIEEQNASLVDFITSYDNSEMDSYRSILFNELANGRDSWSNEDYENFAECLHEFNLRCENHIEY